MAGSRTLTINKSAKRPADGILPIPACPAKPEFANEARQSA
jgi:hypothetical protein